MERLLDGRGQSKSDSPAESVFLNDKNVGKFLVDLGKVVRVRKINTYSWHEGIGPIHPPDVPHPPDSPYTAMAPQRYTLYGAPRTARRPLKAIRWSTAGHEFATLTPTSFSPSPLSSIARRSRRCRSAGPTAKWAAIAICCGPRRRPACYRFIPMGSSGTRPPSSASSMSTRRKRGAGSKEEREQGRKGERE